MTVREPEFDARQVALLQAVAFMDADVGPHGQPMSEASDSRADAARKGGWHYEANALPRTDHAAKELASKQKAYYDKWPDADKSAHLWQVRKVVDD